MLNTKKFLMFKHIMYLTNKGPYSNMAGKQEQNMFA